MKKALVILPGVTADRRKRSFLAGYFRAHTGGDVFLPSLCQRFGLSFCAGQLRRFLKRRIVPPGYDQVHFLCFISGGFILRMAVSQEPFGKWGRVVYVRSPLQEQVPRLLVARYGRILTQLKAGKMVVDLAGKAKDRLPFPDTGREQGLVLERGVSRLAATLGLRAEDFDGLRAAGEFKLPVSREVILADVSHDEVYSSEPLLGKVVTFLEKGSFEKEG
ncbi:MAG: hypothetical protein JXB04_08840 [Kiritimatiellae bacterium]|nr:hypothetical protein [Kiritimatiellia bacterium]